MDFQDFVFSARNLNVSAKKLNLIWAHRIPSPRYMEIPEITFAGFVTTVNSQFSPRVNLKIIIGKP